MAVVVRRDARDRGGCVTLGAMRPPEEAEEEAKAKECVCVRSVDATGYAVCTVGVA